MKEIRHQHFKVSINAIRSLCQYQPVWSPISVCDGRSLISDTVQTGMMLPEAKIYTLSFGYLHRLGNHVPQSYFYSEVGGNIFPQSLINNKIKVMLIIVQYLVQPDGRVTINAIRFFDAPATCLDPYRTSSGTSDDKK
jgi:hypothetical protein